MEIYREKSFVIHSSEEEHSFEDMSEGSAQAILNAIGKARSKPTVKKGKS